MNSLLEIRDVSISFQLGSNLFQRGGSARLDVVKNLSLSVRRNQIFGLVGESGSGKTTLARAIVGLNSVSSGSITFGGTELLGRHGLAVNHPKIQMVFQDPNNSLEPENDGPADPRRADPDFPYGPSARDR